MEAAAARVLSRIWLCNVTTYKNRFLALTPTSRRSSSARSALMEVPNDESARTPLPLTDWENYDRQSPAAPPGIFFLACIFPSPRTKSVPFSATGGSFNSDQNKVAPKANSSLYVSAAAVRKTHQLSSRRRPAAQPEHTHQTGLPRVIWNFLPRPNARVWVPSFITASKKKLHTLTHSFAHTASQQQRCKLSSKSVIIILWRPWLCIGTYCCGLILYYTICWAQKRWPSRI